MKTWRGFSTMRYVKWRHRLWYGGDSIATGKLDERMDNGASYKMLGFL